MSGFVIPVQTADRGHFILFVALDDESLGRVTQHDPFDLRLSQIMAMEPWSHLKLLEIVVGYANPADLVEIQAMQSRGAGAGEIMRYLARGRAFMPDRGDGGAVRQLG